ncbi:glycoside hydrolase family 130 protein [Spirosoma sp. BT702]|uniref:Glycoside hydrolase family 130 protein n=1 Tax=Spirosoma profusum TaxID=2771354 RepID=A0A927ANH9_9BACT|nr:glycoside hydrolase family 130 protein [Spirosoma profusum]MBD2701894.1 glycoside hydrolase family 130 protein [Spirosoma profusum]
MKNYQLKRLSDQPILQTSDVKPSIDGFDVLGAFNPGACIVNNEVILLLRVAEAPGARPGFVKVPLLEEQNGVPTLIIKEFPEPEEDFDPRVVTIEGKAYLTSLSHLRLARSKDGIHFTVDEKPFLFPARMDESYGIEDARITFLDGKYWITYTAVSEHGPGVGLAVTTDFLDVERIGMILPPPNKDVALFPEKINGKYVLFHRPMVSDIGRPSIWLAESIDGEHWGNNRYLFGGRGANNPRFAWEGGKIGGGPEPMLTDEGWLLCYHGADETHAYSLALALLDKTDPTSILDRSDLPLLSPELPWEREGFFPNVVFSNGWVRWPEGSDKAGQIWVYYGAADDGVGLAELVQS